MKQLHPYYKKLQSDFARTTRDEHPSQTHGLMCGLLCGSETFHSNWQELIFEKRKNKKTLDTLQTVFADSKEQLQNSLLNFQLLLPEEDGALPERAEALTLWCQGFLTGLKLAQIPMESQQEEEVIEAINDLIAIAKMNYEEVVESEEDEEAYAELVEFVRMAVILIYEAQKVKSLLN